jgi:hypothetical protein
MGIPSIMTPAKKDRSVFLIDANGQNRRKLINQAIDFYWCPDGNSLLYSWQNYVPPEVAELAGRPFRDPGYEWHVVDIASGRDDILIPAPKFCGRFLCWADRRHPLFESMSAFALFLMTFDLDTKKTNEIVMRTSGYGHFEGAATSPGGRTVLSISPPLLSGRTAGDIYELTSAFQLGRHLVSIRDGEAECLMWNGDREVFFSQQIVIPSIYKYDLDAGRKQLVLQGSGDEGLHLKGLLEGSGLIVLDEGRTRSPRYMLEVRQLDGSRPIPLISGEKQPGYYGWVSTS